MPSHVRASDVAALGDRLHGQRCCPPCVPESKCWRLIAPFDIVRQRRVLTIRTRADLEKYSDICELVGDLIIDFDDGQAPETLDNHFTRLTKVTGSVGVGSLTTGKQNQNDGLARLGNALSRLETVSGTVGMGVQNHPCATGTPLANVSLVSTDTAFASLRSIGNWLVIDGCAVLANLGTSSFGRLEYVGLQLYIVNNPQLANLGTSSFGRLEYVGLQLYIVNNPQLGNLALAFTREPRCVVAGTIRVAANGAPVVANGIRTLCGAVEDQLDWDVVDATGTELEPPTACDP